MALPPVGSFYTYGAIILFVTEVDKEHFLKKIWKRFMACFVVF